MSTCFFQDSSCCTSSLLLLHLEVAEAQTVLVEGVQGPLASHGSSDMS